MSDTPVVESKRPRMDDLHSGSSVETLKQSKLHCLSSHRLGNYEVCCDLSHENTIESSDNHLAKDCLQNSCVKTPDITIHLPEGNFCPSNSESTLEIVSVKSLNSSNMGEHKCDRKRKLPSMTGVHSSSAKNHFGKCNLRKLDGKLITSKHNNCFVIEKCGERSRVNCGSVSCSVSSECGKDISVFHTYNGLDCNLKSHSESITKANMDDGKNKCLDANLRTKNGFYQSTSCTSTDNEENKDYLSVAADFNRMHHQCENGTETVKNAHVISHSLVSNPPNSKSGQVDQLLVGATAVTSQENDAHNGSDLNNYMGLEEIVNSSSVSNEGKCELKQVNNGVEFGLCHYEDCHQMETDEHEHSPLNGTSIPGSPSGLLKKVNGDSSSVSSKRDCNRRVAFEGVRVYYFDRSQGFTCVPSQGGSTLGMASEHWAEQEFTLSSYRKARGRQKRAILHQLCLQGKLSLPLEQSLALQREIHMDIERCDSHCLLDDDSSLRSSPLLDRGPRLPSDDEDSPPALVLLDNDGAGSSDTSLPVGERSPSNLALSQDSCPLTLTELSNSASSFEDGELCSSISEATASNLSDDDDVDESGESEISYLEDYYFLQPVPIKRRRGMLREAGIQRIDHTERFECQEIRLSREFCGCGCPGGTCSPESGCPCAREGISCQVDRANFPCACAKQGCRNPVGRIEFNPLRVKTHYLHTQIRLEKERQSGDEMSRTSTPFNSTRRGSCRDCQDDRYLAALARELRPGRSWRQSQGSTSTEWTQPVEMNAIPDVQPHLEFEEDEEVEDDCDLEEDADEDDDMDDLEEDESEEESSEVVDGAKMRSTSPELGRPNDPQLEPITSILTHSSVQARGNLADKDWTPSARLATLKPVGASSSLSSYYTVLDDLVPVPEVVSCHPSEELQRIRYQPQKPRSQDVQEPLLEQELPSPTSLVSLDTINTEQDTPGDATPTSLGDVVKKSLIETVTV